MKSKNKDKQFPIIFMLVALVLTFGVFLINSLKLNITGQAIADGSAGNFLILTLPVVLLIVFMLAVGLFILKNEK